MGDFYSMAGCYWPIVFDLKSEGVWHPREVVIQFIWSVEMMVGGRHTHIGDEICDSLLISQSFMVERTHDYIYNNLCDFLSFIICFRLRGTSMRKKKILCNFVMIKYIEILNLLKNIIYTLSRFKCQNMPQQHY